MTEQTNEIDTNRELWNSCPAGKQQACNVKHRYDRELIRDSPALCNAKLALCLRFPGKQVLASFIHVRVHRTQYEANVVNKMRVIVHPGGTQDDFQMGASVRRPACQDASPSYRSSHPWVVDRVCGAKLL